MKKKLIVMEDDAFLREFYSFVFNKVGYLADLLEDGDLFFEKLNIFRIIVSCKIKHILY